MAAASISCPRCRLPLQGMDAQVEPVGVCLSCALETARIPLGPPQNLECRWSRDEDGLLQRGWVRVATRPDRLWPRRVKPFSGEAAGTMKSPELWLKVGIHIAGFAALLATPSVTAFMKHLSDQLRLMR